ncbi:MAG: hypothetical protein HY078_16315 [Elusimicrobia bacterium]|nr:hypothetical protein [Elusimicrobiota bacterium]
MTPPKPRWQGTGRVVAPLLLLATVPLLSHVSGYKSPPAGSAPLDLALVTTPYGLVCNLLLGRHPEWQRIYVHATVRPGFGQLPWLLAAYALQAAAAWRWSRR